MQEWIRLAGASEISPGKSKVVKFLGQSVALFNTQGDVHAIDNTCPHQGGPLGEGTLEGDVVTCPWHAWRYNIKTGCPVLTPNVRTFQVRKNGETIEIGVTREDLEEYQRAQRGEGLPSARDTEADPVHQVLEQITLARTLDEVLDKIYSGLQQIVPHNRLGIALIDEPSGRLVQVKTRSDRRILLADGYSSHIAGSSLERILKLGEARIIDDLQEHLAKRPSAWTRLIVEEGMRSSLTLPLKVEGKPIGVVFFTSVVPRGFSEAHVGFLKQIAGHLSILIEKGRWVSELAQSNERYRTLYEMSNEGIFLFASPEESFVTVNENLSGWLGYRVEELSRLSMRHLMSPDELLRMKGLVETLSEERGPAVFETAFTRMDGGKLPVEVRVVRVEHRGKIFLQGLARDLSEVKALNEQLRSLQSFEDLIGKNSKMLEVYELIRLVGPLSTTVLIQGESGTGKELVARAIHRSGPRSKRPFVRVNCGALVETLLESELFGHVRGAFTGATVTRQGRFEVADGGTIFLDEVADLTPATQVKLLRVLQEGEFEKVGSSTTQKVEVRVIAATNRELKAALKKGAFREDLYFRLNVVPVVIPPLRERREDIPLLIEHFTQKFNRLTGKSIHKISPGALGVLMEYPYPGNVRELENIIEHAFVMCPGNLIEESHLPPEVSPSKRDIVSSALLERNPLRSLERELIRKVVEQCGGKPQLAAKRLGISRTTLWRKLRLSA